MVRTFLCTCVVALGSCVPVLAQDKNPEQALRENGLTKVGTVYVLEGEKKAPQAVASLTAMQRMLEGEERQRAQLRGQIRNGQSAMSRWEADLRGAIARLQRIPKTDVDRYNATVGEINTLQSQIREGGKALADFEAKLSKVPDSRDKYITLVLETTSTFEATAKKYEALGEDDKLTTALAKLNETAKPKVKIGPSPQFEQNVRFIKRVRETVDTEVVKLTIEGGVPTAPVMLNNETSVPMVIDSGAALVTITSAVAQRVGLRPGPNDPKITLVDASGRKTQAAVMNLRSVRLGQHTVEDVQCAIMPADSKADACLLGGTFLQNFVYKTDLSKGEMYLSHLKKPATGAPSTGGK